MTHQREGRVLNLTKIRHLHLMHNLCCPFKAYTRQLNDQGVAHTRHIEAWAKQPCRVERG